MSEREPSFLGAKVLVGICTLLIAGMGAFWTVGVVFMTAMGAKAPPTQMYLILFSSLIVAVIAAGASIILTLVNRLMAAIVSAFAGLLAIPSPTLTSS